MELRIVALNTIRITTQLIAIIFRLCYRVFIMDGKYVVRNKINGKWVSLDFHDGTDVIYVDRLTNAILFDNSDDAEMFLLECDINKGDCELNVLKVFATVETWE